jgi:tyrosyl-tRNA synthetase
MIRKEFGTENKACGLTTNLILDKHGNKFGKSSGNPI